MTSDPLGRSHDYGGKKEGEGRGREGPKKLGDENGDTSPAIIEGEAKTRQRKT